MHTFYVNTILLLTRNTKRFEEMAHHILGLLHDLRKDFYMKLQQLHVTGRVQFSIIKRHLPAAALCYVHNCLEGKTHAQSDTPQISTDY